MEDLWNILVPLMVIGAIFVSVFAENRKNIENRKNAKKSTTDITQLTELLFGQLSKPAHKPKSESEVKQVPIMPSKQDMPGDNTQSVTTSSKNTLKRKEAKSTATTKVAVPQPESDIYNKKTDDMSDAMNDIRRAMIAHEILKRKF